MQEGKRSNEARSRETKAALLDAARALFVEHGYVDSSTPMIAKSAGITRGALYHHFSDKKAVFRAVVQREAERVSAAIENSVAKTAASTPLERLLEGADAYLRAMQVPGRTRLLLVDGPALLGRAEIAKIEGEHATASLKSGLEALLPGPNTDPATLAALCDLLSAMFDQAALRLSEGASASTYQVAIHQLLTGLSRPDQER